LEFPNASATIKVELTLTNLDDKSFNISRFTITKNNASHDVIHLWYRAWPDNGVVAPDDFNLLIQTYYDNTNHTSKTLVHCSSGVERTGTFVAALLYCRFQKKIDIDCIILFLRRCRMIQVQTIEQYALLIENQDNLPQRPRPRTIIRLLSSLPKIPNSAAPDATAATHAAAANPAQPAATVAAAAATDHTVPVPNPREVILLRPKRRNPAISAVPVASATGVTAPVSPTTPPTAPVASTTVMTAPVASRTAVNMSNKTLTIAPTRTLSNPLYTFDIPIESKIYDNITKIFKTTFKNGTVATAQQLESNSQKYNCKILPSPNLIAQP
jgi:hypothetical protein